MTEPVALQSDDGLALEAELDPPVDDGPGVVLCHPHPQMGGTMNAPLLVALRDRLVEANWGVLRFNFRGIGDSEGTSSTGIAELADARAAVRLLRERMGGRAPALAGWSFGAVVAVRIAIEDDSLASCLAVAPPVGEKPGITAGLPDAAGTDLGVRTLILVGERDEHVSVEDCRSWAETAGADFEILAAANHFFWARYDKLADRALRFLSSAS